MAKVVNNYVKQKPQNRENYGESPEFSPVLALFIFEKCVVEKRLPLQGEWAHVLPMLSHSFYPA